MFGRRSSAEETPTETEKVTGKGRPTPTRKEAEAARKARLNTPRTRKEQAAARRNAMREGRMQTRAALTSGDDRYLPARDQGPVKRYVRDWVDSRRTVGEFLMPAFVVILIVFFISAEAARFGQYLWYAVILLMIFDAVRLSRGVKSAVTAKFGADQASGLTMYTIMRGLQMRRLRLPKPQVKAGDSI